MNRASISDLYLHTFALVQEAADGEVMIVE
jgi:hypothetical protein